MSFIGRRTRLFCLWVSPSVFALMALRGACNVELWKGQEHLNRFQDKGLLWLVESDHLGTVKRG